MTSEVHGEPGKGPGVWGPAHRRLTIGLLLTISITAFEALAVATVMPATAGDLGGGIGWYGWVFSGFMLANLVGIPAAGVLSDRGGPARPFLAGCILFAAGLLMAGVATSMPLLVAGRVAQGFGAGALSSIVYVAVARGYKVADQPRMLALLASAWVVPGLIGPAAAAALAAQLGWRSVFILLVPMTLLAMALSWKGVRDLGAGAKDSATPMRPALQLAAGATLALAAAEIRQLETALVCAIVGAAVALPALKSLLPPGTLRAAPGAPAALAAKALVTFAFFGAEAFLPLSLTTVRGESLAMAGLALTAGTLCWTAGTWIQERVVTRVDKGLLVQAGLALTALAVVGAASVVLVPSPAPVAMLSWALAGLGIGLAYPTTTLIVFEQTREGEEGGAASALQLANVLGVALGTGLGGAVLGGAAALGRTQAEGIVAIDTLMLAAALIGLLAALRCGRPALRPLLSSATVLP